MGDQKKWGDATQDKKNREMKHTMKKKWEDATRTKKRETGRDKKIGETRRKRKKMGR